VPEASLRRKKRQQATAFRKSRRRQPRPRKALRGQRADLEKYPNGDYKLAGTVTGLGHNATIAILLDAFEGLGARSDRWVRVLV